MNRDRPALDAVVFDAGGTLVRLDYEWIALMLAGLGVPVAQDALRRAEVAGRSCYDAAWPAAGDPGARQPAVDRPLPPIATYWRGMLEAAGCPADRLDAALQRLDERQQSDHFLWAKSMEGARGAIDELERMGLKLACVSNSDGRAEEHLLRFGLREGLEFVIDSAVVGIEKPDPRIFQLALARLEVPAERAIYVGDFLSVDEIGSRAAGMAFVLLDPYGTYARNGTASIAGIEQLPAFIASHFRLGPLAEPGRPA